MKAEYPDNKRFQKVRPLSKLTVLCAGGGVLWFLNGNDTSANPRYIHFFVTGGAFADTVRDKWKRLDDGLKKTTVKGCFFQTDFRYLPDEKSNGKNSKRMVV